MKKMKISDVSESSHYDIMHDKINHLHEKIFDESETNKNFLELEYVNLGITRLHNVYFQLIADKMSGGNKTEFLRSVLNNSMLENKDLFEKAKEIIMKESGSIE